MEPTLPTTVQVPPGMLDFDELYRNQRPKLVAAVNATTRCGADAATEAVDEAFVKALKHWDRVAVMDAPAGWIFTVARNHVNRTRSRQARERDLLPGSRLGTAMAHIPDHERRRELWDAVGELPERQRLAVALRYLADLTELEVAATMGIARGTVAATLHAARTTLAARLTEPESSSTAQKDRHHA